MIAKSGRWTTLADLGKPPPPDPVLKTYFDQGSKDGFAGKKHRPPSACKGPEYAFGYLNGYVRKHFRKQIDWAPILDAYLGKGYDDGEKRKLPRHRPKRVATKIRNLNILLEITRVIYFTPKNKTETKLNFTQTVMPEVAERFGLSERTVWDVWGDDTLPDNVFDHLKFQKSG